MSKNQLPCGRRTHERIQKINSTSNRSCLEKLDIFVQEKKLNKSNARKQTLEVMLTFSEHFSIPELVKKVQKEHPSVGAATVYRNIPIFVAARILRESFTDKGGQPFYEVERERHHDHIVCLDCNGIFEFHEESIENAQNRVSKNLSFLPAQHKHVIYAHCELLKKNLLKK